METTGLFQEQTNSSLSDYCPINSKINGVPQCSITLSGLRSRDKVIKINRQCYDINAFKTYLDTTEFGRINTERIANNDLSFNDMSEAITESFSSISTKPDHVKIWDPLRNPIVGEELTSLFFLYNPNGVFTRSEADRIRNAGGGKSKKKFRKAFTKKKNKKKNKKTSLQSRKKRNNKYK